MFQMKGANSKGVSATSYAHPQTPSSFLSLQSVQAYTAASEEGCVASFVSPSAQPSSPYFRGYQPVTRPPTHVPQRLNTNSHTPFITSTHGGGPISSSVFAERVQISPNSECHVYVKGLPAYYTQEMFYLLAKRYGIVDKIKLVVDHGTEQCLGYGFIEYSNSLHAANAIHNIPLYQVQGSRTKLSASFAYPPSSRSSGADDLEHTNIYISGLPFDMTRSELDEMFGKFGPIVESKVINAGDPFINASNHNKQFSLAFVRFAHNEHARTAIQRMNGAVLGIAEDQRTYFTLTVKFAQQPLNPKQKEKVITKILEVRSLTSPAPSSFSRSNLNQDSYARNQDSYARNQDSYAHKPHLNVNAPDPYARTQDAYPRNQDPYTPNHSGPRSNVSATQDSMDYLVSPSNSPAHEEYNSVQSYDYAPMCTNEYANAVPPNAYVPQAPYLPRPYGTPVNCYDGYKNVLDSTYAPSHDIYAQEENDYEDVYPHQVYNGLTHHRIDVSQSQDYHPPFHGYNQNYWQQYPLPRPYVPKHPNALTIKPVPASSPQPGRAPQSVSESKQRSDQEQPAYVSQAHSTQEQPVSISRPEEDQEQSRYTEGIEPGNVSTTS